MFANVSQISEVKNLKQKNMWTLRILKEPIKYQTIGGFLFRLFGVSSMFCLHNWKPSNKKINWKYCDKCKKETKIL